MIVFNNKVIYLMFDQVQLWNIYLDAPSKVEVDDEDSPDFEDASSQSEFPCVFRTLIIYVGGLCKLS